jgi:hypothetical protein
MNVPTNVVFELNQNSPAFRAAVLAAETIASVSAPMVLVKEEKLGGRGKSFSPAEISALAKAGVHVSLDCKSGSDNKQK